MEEAIYKRCLEMWGLGAGFRFKLSMKMVEIRRKTEDSGNGCCGHGAV